MQPKRFSDFYLSTLAEQSKAGAEVGPERTTNADDAERQKQDSRKVKVSGITRYNNVYDKRKYRYRREKIDKPKDTEKYKHLLAVTRNINPEGRHVSTDIEIRSEVLADVFREKYGDLEESQLRQAPPVASPAHFYHAKEELASRLRSRNATELDTELKDALSTALQYVDEDHAKEIRSFDSQIAAGQMSWELLWMLFCPGSLVYHWHELTEQHQVLHFQKLTEVYTDEERYWKAVCNIVANDGNKFGFCPEPLDLQIPYYTGAKDISALPLLPLTLKDDWRSIKKEVLNRGKAYAALADATYFDTSGIAMKEASDLLDAEEKVHVIKSGKGEKNLIKFMTSGRAVADASSFRAFQPNCYFLPTVRRTLDRETLTDEQLMICSPVALGFSLTRKDWCGLPMSRQRAIDWDEGLFGSLVIDPNAKNLIHALVKQHVTADRNKTDLIWKKGGGVIGLLDGNPGCGKTLTAEAIAEVVQRPLYEVSAGELGVNPSDVDKRLALILEVSFRWNAVVLLDEADVFLRKRDSNNAKRNALVSIFLRQLERFRGILIMTTNRLEDCDPAFESRVHFSIYYPDLTADSRRKLWQTFLLKVTAYSGVELDVGEADILTLSQRHLNGREIKNTVASAGSLALQAGEALALKHIEQVLGVSSAWKAVLSKRSSLPAL